jgi:hypothetical protein
MKFIEEKLGSIGSVSFIAYVHDNTSGNDWTNKRTTEVTNVRASVALCQINYHWRETVDGKVTQDKDAWVPLKDVEEVVVETEEKNLNEAYSKAGHPEWNIRLDPPVFALLAKRKAAVNDFDLYDESLANRIAKAMVRAVDLCGGGSKSLSMLRAQDVPPPPKPPEDGPSLEVTMKYIEERLGLIGPVNYIQYNHNNTSGADGTTRRSTEVTNVRASAAPCRIDYHWLEMLDGKVSQDKDLGFALKNVEEVVVETEEKNIKEVYSKAYPEWSIRADPPVFIVLAKRKTGVNTFDLYDESLANRIGKAMVRAVELCGGGDKGPLK